MADGFAEPGWLHMFRMLVGEIHAAREMIALPYHPDLLRSLEEIHRLEKKELARHAPWPAARLRGEGNRHLAAQHLFIRCLHVFRRPRFQDRIICVHDRGPGAGIDYCNTTAVLTFAGIGIVRIGLHWPVSRTRRGIQLKVPEVRVPPEISGPKLGNGIFCGRGRRKRRNKGDRKKADDNTVCEQAAPQSRYQNVCCKRRHPHFSPCHKEPAIFCALASVEDRPRIGTKPSLATSQKPWRRRLRRPGRPQRSISLSLAVGWLTISPPWGIGATLPDR